MDSSPISRWDSLETWYRQLSRERQSSGEPRRWVFRGQRESGWCLRPSLERVVVDRFRRSYTKQRDFETGLSREFRRHFHRYCDLNIDDNDQTRWLALMQHHGAPTRLLDWSYSFYVAVYFAAESAKPETEGAIWALDQDWWQRRAKTVLPPDISDLLEDDTNGFPANNAMLQKDWPAVVLINPFRLDERLAVQQGVFLAPLDLQVPLMDALGDPLEPGGPLRKIPVHWKLPFLTRTLTELRRMNISRRTLFPGLDGFAAGLANEVALDFLWKPHTGT